jgi:excinuclease UvrABC ATPase subunit
VEHDKDMIERADYVDIGPKQGKFGGISIGTPAETLKYNYRTIFKR